MTSDECPFFVAALLSHPILRTGDGGQDLICDYLCKYFLKYLLLTNIVKANKRSNN